MLTIFAELGINSDIVFNMLVFPVETPPVINILALFSTTYQRYARISSEAVFNLIISIGVNGVLSKEEDPLSKVRVFRGKGCQQCNGSGFRGRLGIFELFEIDDQFRQMIVERRGSSLIRATAIEKGMKTMLQDGLAKAFLGETTLDEVLRVAI